MRSALLTRPPKSLRREDLIENGMIVRRVLASPGFPGKRSGRSRLRRAGVDRAPYDPSGIARQLAAVIAAPPRNQLLKACVVRQWSFTATAIR